MTKEQIDQCLLGRIIVYRYWQTRSINDSMCFRIIKKIEHYYYEDVEKYYCIITCFEMIPTWNRRIVRMELSYNEIQKLITTSCHNNYYLL